MVFIMVNKKIKTKLVVEANGRPSNPRPGCLVDHTITGRESYDFYMVCAESRQGVPTPTHFSILVNEIGDQLKPEVIQKLCFKLCYTFYNWGGSVKVPAPIKYADRLANVIGEQGCITPHPYHGVTKGLYFI